MKWLPRAKDGEHPRTTYGKKINPDHYKNLKNNDPQNKFDKEKMKDFNDPLGD